MNENQTLAIKTVRPTKKQRELLSFIDEFIKEHGYSPSYREIMAGCNYTSVATVALHVNSLINRGHLRKRDRSARSLEVVTASETQPENSEDVQGVNWLAEKIEQLFAQAEQNPTDQATAQLQTMIAALGILGLDNLAQNFAAKLAELKSESPQP